jgi:hypothetical protein
MVYDALLGTSPPDYVASFGNSDVQNAADWVKIINDKPADTVGKNTNIIYSSETPTKS